jgi:hypothetical protein
LRIRSYLPLKAFCILRVLLLATDTLAAPGSPTISLGASENVVRLVELQFWMLVVIVGLLSLIGAIYIGILTRRAARGVVDASIELKTSLDEAARLQADTKSAFKQLATIRQEFAAYAIECERRIEELAAVLDDRSTQPSNPLSVARPNFSHLGLSTRANPDLIRASIRSGSLGTASVGRIIKATGLEREALFEIIRDMDDLEVAISKRTGDHVFRIKPEVPDGDHHAPAPIETRVDSTAPPR